MMQSWMALAMSQVGIAGLVQLLTKAMVLVRFREWLMRFKFGWNPLKWLGVLLTCPMCVGFWLGLVFWLSGGVKLGQALLFAGVTTLLVHVVDRVLDRLG